MSSFAIYNYQFAKIIRQAKEQYLFDNGPVEMDAEESFPQRQQIFGAMLDNDYKGEQEISKIKFINGRSDKEFIHRHLIPPTDDIIVMRVANVRTATYVNKDFNEDHVGCYGLLDDLKNDDATETEIGNIVEAGNLIDKAIEQLNAVYEG
jgi:hypothetical protein